MLRRYVQRDCEIHILCVCLENSLEADADKRPELDIHLSVCQVMTHVYRLHCLGRADRGRSCTFYYHSFLQAEFIDMARPHRADTALQKHTYCWKLGETFHAHKII